MVAHAKGEAAAFLREMRALDRRVGAFEQAERLGVARLGLIAPAGVPQESAELAHDTGRGGMIACSPDRRAAPRCNVPARSRVGRSGGTNRRCARRAPAARAPARWPPQGGERLLIVADGVVIGVGRTGPIAGDAQEARAFRLLLAQAEMVAEGDQVLEPLDPGRHTGFELAPDAAVQLHASLHQEVLIDDVLQQRLRKAVLRLESRARLLVDQLGIEQEIELAAHPLPGRSRSCAGARRRSAGRSRRPPGRARAPRAAADRAWRAACPGC